MAELRARRGPSAGRGIPLLAWRQYRLERRMLLSAVSFDLPPQFPAGQFPEEAALVALVARGPADLLHLQQHGVGVAVDEDPAHLLHVAALLALAPEPAAAAAKIARPARALRFFKRLTVHPGHHQHLARVGILSNGRN